MKTFPSILCSTDRAVPISRIFSFLRIGPWSPALCRVLALMMGGACAGGYAQAAHFTESQSATANAANSLSSPRAVATEGHALEVTSSNGNFGTVNLGSTSSTPISITFTFNTAEMLGSTTVVTQGAAGLDFTDSGTGTCKAETAYGAGSTCTVKVNFTPKFPGTRYGAANLLDGSGNLLAAGYLQGTGVGPQVTFLPGTRSIIADAGNSGLSGPEGVAVDGSGNLYIVDQLNNRILKETLSGGAYTQSIVSTNGLEFPFSVAVDGGGNVYIGDLYNNRVLKETLSTAGYIQSIVANSATGGLNSPWGVAVDGSGNVYIADSGSNRVLEETLSAGGYAQSVVANEANNGLDYPTGVAVDGSGNVYIADTGKARVLKETPTAGGYSQSVVADPSTGLSGAKGLAVDGIGNVYVADDGASNVFKETLSAGSYTQSVIADAATNGLSGPRGVAVDGSGNVYIADFLYPQVLKEDLADPPILSFIHSDVGVISKDSPKSVMVCNDGNAALTFSLPTTGDNPSVPADFAWDQSSTCMQTAAGSPTAFALAAGASCTMAFDFKPTTTGYIRELAELTDDSLNMTGTMQGIQLIGLLIPQAITFSQPASPVYSGSAPITLSAIGGASGNPVIFSIVSGPGSLSGTNNSVLNVNGWGTIVIAANQSGNASYSAAPQVTQSVTGLYSQAAALRSPTPLSTLTGTSTTFTWSPGIGPTEYMLYLGSTGVRSSNLYNSGPTTERDRSSH